MRNILVSILVLTFLIGCQKSNEVVKEKPKEVEMDSIVLELRLEKVIKDKTTQDGVKFSWDGYLIHLMAHNKEDSIKKLICGLQNQAPTGFEITNMKDHKLIEGLSAYAGAGAPGPIVKENFRVVQVNPGGVAEIDTLHVRNNTDFQIWQAWANHWGWEIGPTKKTIKLKVKGYYHPSKFLSEAYSRFFDDIDKLACTAVESQPIVLKLP